MSEAHVQSVDRAARILLAVGDDHEPVTVTRLARQLGVHKSTVSRLVSTLARHDLVEVGPSEDRGLRLGPALRRLVHRVGPAVELPALAQPVLDRLSATTGELVTLAVPTGPAVVTIAQSASSHVVSAHTWIGRSAPAYATSDGKVLLAFGSITLPPDPLTATTPATETDRTTLADRLAEVRERGWATSIGEFETGLNGVAAPVFDAYGRCCGAICLSGPEYRVPPERLTVLAQACRAAADELTRLLTDDITGPEA